MIKIAQGLQNPCQWLSDSLWVSLLYHWEVGVGGARRSLGEGLRNGYELMVEQWFVAWEVAGRLEKVKVSITSEAEGGRVCCRESERQTEWVWRSPGEKTRRLGEMGEETNMIPQHSLWWGGRNAAEMIRAFLLHRMGFIIRTDLYTLPCVK